MLTEMRKALMLGVKLGRMSKAEAEREMKKILAVSKVGAKHAKVVVGKAYVAAKKEKKALEKDIKAALKKEKPKRKTARKTTRKPTKRKTTKRTTKKTVKR